MRADEQPASDDRAAPVRRGAVAVIIREGKLLVIRRSQHVPAPLAYCFPGGGIEADESDREALVRELREELGVEVRPVGCLWQSRTAWGVELCWWHAELDRDATLVPDPAEVESVHWLSPAEMVALDGLLDSNRAFLSALAEGKFALEIR